MNKIYNKYKCNFIKEYIEPKEKYNIVSFSIFYMEKYTRHYKNYSKDISVKRQTAFLYNLVSNINNLENGFFGNNWYFRIYYDKSLFNFLINDKCPWIDFFNKYKDNKLIQFVQFNCDYFMNKDFKSHINLFGTFARLYPLFEKNDLLETIVVFDADNFITKKYFDEIILFKKSDYDYNSFCSKYETSFYKDDNYYDPDNCYIRCGMLSVNKKLPEHLWNFILYQLKTYEDKKFADLINKLFIYHTTLMPKKKIKTYKEFEYGMDEIVLNYYVKKFFINNNFKMRVVRYRPMIMPIINTIISHIEFSYRKNRYIINNFLHKILKNEYTGNIKNDLKNFNLLYYSKSLNNDIKLVLTILKNNFDIIKKIGFPKVIIDFVDNVSYNNYIEANEFSDYFVTLTKPNFL
jgi:hypothetical protein